MQKLILTLCAALCSASLWGFGVALELDARYSKITMASPAGLQARHPANNASDRVFYWEMYSTQSATPEWKSYEISFVPDRSGGVTLGLSSTSDCNRNGQYEWIEYDKLEVTGAELYNPSFEQFSEKKEFFRWRYYTKQSEKVGKTDAADGKNYISVNRVYPVRQAMMVHADQKVTLKFMARKGVVTGKPADTGFGSDQTAPSEAQMNSKMRVDVKSWPYHGKRGIRFSQIKADEGTSFYYPSWATGDKEKQLLIGLGKKELCESWEKHEITFTPNNFGEVELEFCGQDNPAGKVVWTLYDKIEVKGAKLLNGSFENLSGGRYDRWENFPFQLRTDYPGVPDGKNCGAASYSFSLRQIITVTKDQPVTVSFWCRAGGITPRPVIERNKTYKNDHPASYYRVYNKQVKYLPLADKGIPGSSIRPLYPWVKPGVVPPVAMEQPVAEKKGSIKTVDIPFDLKEESGIARTVPMRFGIPFPAGGIYDLRGLSIADPSRKRVPAQFTAISFWPDHAIKIVLVEFNAPLKANESARWVLRKENKMNAPSSLNTDLKAWREADGFKVETGVLSATVSKSKFAFLQNVTVDGKTVGSFSPRGLEVVDEGGKLHSSAELKLNSLRVESSGSLRLTLRADGVMSDDMGKFTVWMTFYAHSAEVDFAIRYHNNRLVTEFTDLRSMKVRFMPAKPLKSVKISGVSAQRFFQQDDTMLQIGSRYFNRLMEDSGKAGDLTFALRDGAKRYPKAISVADGALDFELLPVLPNKDFGKDLPYWLNYNFCEGLYRMKWGMGFTEELKFDFSGKTSPAEWNAKSVVPVIDREWVRSTKVFPGIPGKVNAFSKLDEQAVAAFYEHLKVKERQREYGYLNYGDWFGERGRNWTNNEYDMAHGLFMLFLRTGNRDAFRWAMIAARHQADVDIVHAYPDPFYVGANAQHGIGHTGANCHNYNPAPWSLPYDGTFVGSNGHTWSEGMTEAWMLGGDSIPMESALMLGEHLVNYTAPLFIRLSTHERSAGWSIPALLGIYRATGKEKYLAAARRLVGIIMDEQKFDLGGAWPHKLPGDHTGRNPDGFGNCPYLVGIVLNAMEKFYDVEPSAEVKRSIVSGANWLKRSFDRSRVGWSYGTGFNGSWYWEPIQGLNLIIAPGLMTGGRLSGDREIYEDAKLVAACATLTGISSVGKSLSISLCMMPTLYEEMNRFAEAHPEEGIYSFAPDKVAQLFGVGFSNQLRMRGPVKKAFEVVAAKPAVLELSHIPIGTVPNPRPNFNCKITDASGKVIFNKSGSIGKEEQWKIALPAAGRYQVEIDEDLTAYWNASGENCRVRAEFRQGYEFPNCGISRQNIIIPAGTKSFTLKFFGGHQGGCFGFLLDPQGKFVGSGYTTTVGNPRLPWFKDNKKQPVAEIPVSLAQPTKKESAWKVIFITNGDVLMDLIGAKAQIGLSEK